MVNYFIPKTGFNFFDVARAYGLGIVAYALSDEPNITVEDMGFAYKITANGEINTENIERIQSYLPSPDFPRGQYWEYVLKTSNKKKTLEQNTREFFKEQKNVDNLLKKLSSIDGIIGIFDSSFKRSKSQKKKEKPPSLPQSLELGAGKGIRSVVSLSLTEKTLELPLEHVDQLYLAILGSLNASIYSLNRSGRTTYTYIVYPLPGKVDIEFIVTEAIIKELRKALEKSHKGGLLPTLAYIAIEMEIEKRNSFLAAPTFIPSLLYGVMARSPQAKDKPYSAGKYPLDLVSKSPREVLFFWKKILKISNRKGYENIAISLSDFLADPTLNNYYTYIRLHLNNELKEDTIKFGSYEQESLMEVIKNVVVE